MYRLEKTPRQDHRFLNPSFSTTLLNKIYRSIDEGEKRKSGENEMKFYRETTTIEKKQSRTNGKCNRALKEEKEEVAAASFRRACLLDKWMDNRNKVTAEMDRTLRDRDQDVLFFSSTSSSSDSSSGGFSSSDTESMYGARSHASCFAPPRPKPVRTSVSARSEKSEKAPAQRRHSALFYEQKGTRLFDGCCHSSNSQRIANASHEESLIKSKSRALRIYNNLKKVKQPISPGGKLTNFLNSLFATGNAKKTKSSTTSSVGGGCEDANVERKAKSGQASTCSSATSFSRSCLSKSTSSPSFGGKTKSFNGVKRTVRFVDEDNRSCGHKCLYAEEEEDTRMMPVSVPTAWKIGRSPPTKKNEEELLKFPVLEKSKRVEEAAREFLEEHRRNQKKSDFVLRDFPIIRTKNDEEEDDDDEDDAASYSSSDLFELDHLAVMGNGRYSEELPVYETTRVSTNRAIANGLIM